MPTEPGVQERPQRRIGLKKLRPIRIDLYILIETLGPLLGAVAFFSFIFLMFQALRLAEALIEHSVPPGILLKMIGLMIVSFLPFALPLAFLISVLVAFGRLSSDSELVALKAHGVSIHRIAAPVIALSIGVSALSLALNMNWVPDARMALKGTLLQVTNTKPIATIREGTFTSGFFDLLLYAEKVDQKTNELQKVFIYDERDAKSPLAIVARAGEIVPMRTTEELGSSIALRLFDGDIHSNDLSSGTYQKSSFREYQIILQIAAGSSHVIGKPSMQPYRYMKESLKSEIAPQRRREFQTEIMKRRMTALAPLIFVFIGIGFGSIRGRTVRSGAALTTLAIIVPFYLLQSGAESLAYGGKINPILAMMIPNLLLAAVGVWGYRKATW
jgi:LPS export ABC transporter permease LptF